LLLASGEKQWWADGVKNQDKKDVSTSSESQPLSPTAESQI